MKSSRWDLLVFCVLFTLIGAVGGWYTASGGGAAPADEHHDDHDDHDHDDHEKEFSERTLATLGVRMGVAKLGPYVRYRSVPAVIERTPFSLRPIHAPIGGRVEEILVEVGTVVSPGQPLAVLVRDPIARPMLQLTASILAPAREEVHHAVVELRKTLGELEILQTELERVAAFTETVGGEKLPVLPRQRTIDLRYQIMRTKSAHHEARLELVKHGFTGEQIEAIGKGASIPKLGEEAWKRALDKNGLWTEGARKLFGMLPSKLRGERWTVATVGELAAGGLITDELLAWLGKVPKSCTHFLEIGSLLQQGYTVADVKRLHEQNALDPVIRILAPETSAGGAGGPAQWDVHEIGLKVGAHVEGGEVLVSLLDPRELFLRAEAVGSEQEDLLRAVEQGSSCRALPLVKGSGPALEALKIDRVTASQGGARSLLGYAKVRNQAFPEGQLPDGSHRSWRLRSGLRYHLRVPTQTLDKAIVLPSAAIAQNGPARVVFVPHGKSFDPVEVEVVHEDDEETVIAVNERSKLAPGDRLVVSGAYALGLALLSSSDAVDPHAGHEH